MNQTEYYIQVSEPFDFNGPEGSNIHGKVIRKINNKRLIFKTIYPIKLDDAIGEILIVDTRWKGVTFDTEEFKDSIPVNVSLVFGKYTDDFDLDKIEEYPSRFVIVGSFMRK